MILTLSTRYMCVDGYLINTIMSMMFDKMDDSFYKNLEKQQAVFEKYLHLFEEFYPYVNKPEWWLFSNWDEFLFHYSHFRASLLSLQTNPDIKDDADFAYLCDTWKYQSLGSIDFKWLEQQYRKLMKKPVFKNNPFFNEMHGHFVKSIYQLCHDRYYTQNIFNIYHNEADSTWWFPDWWLFSHWGEFTYRYSVFRADLLSLLNNPDTKDDADFIQLCKTWESQTLGSIDFKSLEQQYDKLMNKSVFQNNPYFSELFGHFVKSIHQLCDDQYYTQGFFCIEWPDLKELNNLTREQKK